MGETAALRCYVFAPLEELIKCCMAAAPSVFTVMTLYCAYLCKILALGVEAGLRNSAQYSGSIELCVLL